MKASEIIELIIERHESKNDEPITMFSDLYLEPMLNYSGKMARKAYWGFSRKPFHKDRLYCGILDHRIMNNSGKMEHFGLIERVLPILNIQDIRGVFDGGDPETLGGTDEEKVLLSEIQCSFLEQELNWGPHDFQLRTFFGLDTIEDPLFSNAVPRDFFMCYLEKSFEVYNETQSVEAAMKSIDEHYEYAEVARKSVMKPPKQGSGRKSRVLPEYRGYIYSNITETATPWIEPYLDRIKELCIRDGVSPFWEKAYS
jgi:hypothetical protein